MKILSRLVFLMLCLCSLSVFAQRDTIAVNDNWQFVTDKSSKGFNEKWFEGSLSNARIVQLPHTWNVEDENQNHYGWGWYQKKLNIPTNWKNKNVVLQFGAMNHTAHIYINGKKVQENIGDGFNKFFINLNGKINYGKENIITVAVNNDYGKNKVPFGSSFDWPNDGGLIRPVALIVSGRPAAAYIHATPTLDVVTNSGQLKIKLGFNGVVNNRLKFAIIITEENQPTKNILLQTTATPTWQNGEAIVDYNLPKVAPWHFDFPNLTA